MFDYQAGEKYKMTLIMVGLAGVMAGIFFSILFTPTPEPMHRRPGMSNARGDEISSRRAVGATDAVGSAGAVQAMTPQAAPVTLLDPIMAKTLIEQWLPLAWDLSAGSAKGSQERAMQYMTADCALAYRKNIWTADLAKQIDESGLHSAFSPDKVAVGEPMTDGSIVVFVEGVQTFNVPGKGSSSRSVKLEYMLKQTADGLRISGISEGGKSL